MERRKFFKNIGATLVGAALFPGVVVKAVSAQPGFNIKKLDERIKQIRREWSLKQARRIYQEHLKTGMTVKETIGIDGNDRVTQYPLTLDECYKPSKNEK